MEPVAAASPVMNNSYGRILVPATQYALDESSRDSGASDNLVINETTESKNITGVSEPGDEDFEDDIIPETQYMPDQVSNAGDSRPVSRQSSQPDFGTNDDHFEPPINADALLKSSANENESDEDNELIHVDQDSNAPWQLEESQAVIGHVETELLDNVQSRSVCNDKLTDSIDLSSSRLEDASKLDVEAPVQSATKTNNKLEQNVNMSAASISSSLEVDRSTSVTPDLDIVMTPIASTRSTGRAESTPRPIEANKSLEEDILRTFPQKEDRSSSHALSEVKTSQVNRLSSVAHDANDDRSVTPDLFTQAIINAPTVNEPIGIDPMVAEMTDDSLSNDNDLYGTSTQAFPLPPPQPVRVAQESNIPALEADEDSVEKEATVDAATAVDQDGDSVNNDADDADSNDFYNAQTQINPLAKASVTPLKMPLSGHSSTENSLNKSANNRMAPPALPNKPRESLANDVSATESNKPAEDDLFAAATQVFVPVQPAAISKKKSLSLAADPSDSIYDRETQKIVSLDESAKKNRKSVRTTQEIWPTSTPVKSVVANLPVKSIEEKGRLVEGKPKTWLSKKWLFDSEADCDDERDPSPPPKRSRSSTKKCVSDTNVPLTSKVAKRIVGDPYVSEAEIEQINKRRVSVVLERPKIDVNSNESPASAYPATNKSDRNAEKAPTASNRPNGSSDDAASVSHQKGRKTKILTEKAVSDISPNRPTRAKVRFVIRCISSTHCNAFTSFHFRQSTLTTIYACTPQHAVAAPIAKYSKAPKISKRNAAPAEAVAKAQTSLSLLQFESPHVAQAQLKLATAVPVIMVAPTELCSPKLIWNAETLSLPLNAFQRSAAKSSTHRPFARY